MATSKPKPKAKLVTPSTRKYESEALALQSLRLIAAPKPEDDLSDEELDALSQGNTHSSRMIRHLIEYIKTI